MFSFASSAIEDEKSFFWKGSYHLDMNTRDTLITDLNVLAGFDPKVPESYQDCDYLMLGNLTPTIQTTVINRLRHRPKLIVLDTMNFWMEHTPKELAVALEMIDVLTINAYVLPAIVGRNPTQHLPVS